jgi:hypothetical protein
MNSHAGALHVNMWQSWDTSENADKRCKNPYGSRLSKDTVYNIEETKLTEFRERNFFEILNRKYDSDDNSESHLLTRLGKMLQIMLWYQKVW